MQSRPLHDDEHIGEGPSGDVLPLFGSFPLAKLPRPRFSIRFTRETCSKVRNLPRFRVQAPPSPADTIKSPFRRVSLENGRVPLRTVGMVALQASSAAVFSVSLALADTTWPENIEIPGRGRNIDNSGAGKYITETPQSRLPNQPPKPLRSRTASGES